MLQIFGSGGVKSVLGKGYSSFIQYSGSILIIGIGLEVSLN
ncbi:MAG: hypothetical protein ACFCU7_12815 [Pleurocapsa sp.]